MTDLLAAGRDCGRWGEGGEGDEEAREGRGGTAADGEARLLMGTEKYKTTIYTTKHHVVAHQAKQLKMSICKNTKSAQPVQYT